jgi:hypothetical protein
MDNKQPKNDKDDSWKHLPDTDNLLVYLDRKDLIELSKCRKSYRNKLEQQVLENLNLDTWKSNNEDIYEELTESYKLENVLEFLKNDLDNKLKYVKKFALNCQVDYSFAQVFIKLLPNVKSLSFYGCECCICTCCDLDCTLGGHSENILKNMKHLEHIYFNGINGYIDECNPQNQIFPKSIKSLNIGKIHPDSYDEVHLFIYNTIDVSYVNLYSLTIVTNRMLQKLSSGMPNLKEVEIKYIDYWDKANIIAFLKANPQLKKLNIQYFTYNEEIFKIILSYQYLEHLNIKIGSCEGMEVNNLPPNYSIKYLQIYNSLSDTLALQVINACKNLEYLDLDGDFDWLKVERRINKLKLIYNRYITNDTIIKIDCSRLFNSVNIELDTYNQDEINKIINFKLSNYKIIPYTAKACTLNLLNKTD